MKLNVRKWYYILACLLVLFHYNFTLSQFLKVLEERIKAVIAITVTAMIIGAGPFLECGVLGDSSGTSGVWPS